MKVRTLCPLAAALGVWVGGGDAAAAEPAKPAATKPAEPNPNQQLAEAIELRLKASNAARGADVSIVAHEGTVSMTGVAVDVRQKHLLLAEARSVPGVTFIWDMIAVPGMPPPPSVIPAQGVAPAPMPAPVAPTPVGPAPGGMMPPGPMFGGYAGGPVVEPAPLGAPGQSTPDLQAPPLPPYAWPTYAPYNNVSRVAYPQAYPYNAFPFIGPYYPFPKVPLGWRKVVLEWEDGHWYMGRASAPQDYWKVRFW